MPGCGFLITQPITICDELTYVIENGEPTAKKVELSLPQFARG